MTIFVEENSDVMLNEVKGVIKLHVIPCSRPVRNLVVAQLDKKWFVFYKTKGS
jgi:hypothetical protein